MAEDLGSRRERRRLERWRTNQALLTRLSDLLRELWGEGATVDGEWAGEEKPEEGGRLIVTTSYGSWRIGETWSGSTLVELVTQVRRLTSEREALDWCQTWLGEKGAHAPARQAKTGKKVKIRAIVPAPVDRHIDWSKELQDPGAFWVRAGMPPGARYVDRWEYLDAAGTLLFYVCRFDRLDGSGKFFHKLAYFGPTVGYHLEGGSYEVPAPWPLYGLQELASRPNDPVLVVEGEKACRAARDLLPNYVVVAWPGGDKSPGHCDWSPLLGRKVTLWPDNDNVGVEAMARVRGILLRSYTADVATVPVATLGVGHGWDLADPLPAQLDPFTIAKAAHDLPDWLVDINRRCFVALEGGKAVVFTQQDNPLTGLPDLARLRAADLCLLEDNKQVLTVDARGNPIYAGRGTVWLTHRHRREYAGTVFLPADQVPNGFFNLWRGFSVKPATGTPRRFLSFVWRIICRRRRREFRYVIRWLANLVQNPHRPGMTALVLTGLKGVGKGFFADAVGSLLRSHYAPVSSYDQVVGRFNGYMRHMVLIFVDEAFYAGDRRHVSMINSLITEKLRQYEHKGYDPVVDYNRAHVIIASNSDWVIPASLDERRYAVLEVSAERRQDTAYFGGLKRALDERERQQLLGFLQRVDLEGWTPLAVPRNAELAAQKLESLDDAQSFIVARLRENRWREREPVPALHEAYLKHCQQLGVRHPRSSVQLGRALSKLFGESYHTRPVKTKDGRTTERQAFLPSEDDARRVLAAKLGLTVLTDGDLAEALYDDPGRADDLPF
jgi:hypothetical protein